MNSKFLKFFFFSLFVLVGPVLANEINQDTRYAFPRFEHIASEAGLTQTRISSIIQDRQGYIWIGTGKGFGNLVFNKTTDEPAQPTIHLLFTFRSFDFNLNKLDYLAG